MSDINVTLEERDPIDVELKGGLRGSFQARDDGVTISDDVGVIDFGTDLALTEDALGEITVDVDSPATSLTEYPIPPVDLKESYYTQSEADSTFVDESGDTLSGDLDAQGNMVQAGGLVHKTNIPSGEVLTIPENYGSVIAGPLTGEGRITGDGRLKVV